MGKVSLDFHVAALHRSTSPTEEPFRNAGRPVSWFRPLSGLKTPLQASAHALERGVGFVPSSPGEKKGG